MIIEQVTIKGFQSFREEITVPLNGMSFAVITGPNGSGKSTIFDAISWTLFGKTRVQRDKDSVINDEVDTAECTVDIRLADGSLMRVCRERKWNSKTVLSVHDYNPEDGVWYRHNDHRIAEAQDRIYSSLMLDEDSFFSMCSIEQGSMITGTRFTAANSNQRRNILMGLLPELTQWPYIEEIVAEKHRAMNNQVDEWERDVEVGEQRLSRLTDEKDGNESRLASMKDRDQIVADIDALTDQIARYVKIVDAESEGKDDLKAQLDALEAQRRAKNSEIRAERSEVSGQLKTILAAEDRVESLISSLEKSRDDLDSLERELEQSIKDREDAEERLEGLDEKIQSKAESRDAMKSKLDGLKADRHRMKDQRSAMELQEESSDGASCIVCQSPLSEDHFHDLFDKMRDDFTKLVEDIEECSSDLEGLDSGFERLRRRKSRLESSLSEVKSDITRCETKIRNTKDRISETEEDLGSAKSALRSMPDREGLEERLDSLVPVDATDQEETLRDQMEKIEQDHPLTKEIRKAEREIKDLREDISTSDRLQGRIETQKKEIRTTRSAIREAKTSLTKSMDQRRFIEAARKACGQKGVPSMLIGEILSALEDEQNAILRKMMGEGAFQVEFRQERELKTSDAIRSELDIIVHTPNGLERPIETFSGGERVRLTLSNLFAMVKVFNDRHNGMVKTLLLDEPLGQLDNDALPIVTNIFRDMINDGVVNSIFLMSHQERIIDEAPQKIIVSRDQAQGNTTMIEVG